MKLLITALLSICLATTALGCGGDSTAEADRATPQDSVSNSSEDDGGGEVEQSSSEGEGSGEHSSSSEDDDADRDDSGDSSKQGSEDGDTVSRENPGFIGTGFDSSRNDALIDAQPLDVVTWTTEPAISAGALEAEGLLEEGATLFNPTVDGEGAGFIVYFKGMREPLVLLLPDLGPMYIWETDHTVAPTEQEVEGASFLLRAYSPLFMDVGPSDLEIRVFGYDAGGADALLAVQPVTVP